MTDLVTQAAEVLYPLLTLGAGAVATGAAEQVGAELLESGQDLLSRLRLRRRGGGDVEPAELIAALRSGLAEGLVEPDELEQIIALERRVASVNGGNTYNSVSGGTIGTVIQGGHIEIGGDDVRG